VRTSAFVTSWAIVAISSFTLGFVFADRVLPRLHDVGLDGRPFLSAELDACFASVDSLNQSFGQLYATSKEMGDMVDRLIAEKEASTWSSHAPEKNP
jgi:hypothetical protein